MQATKTTNQDEKHEEILVEEDEVQRLVESLPKTLVSGNMQLVKYQGFWFPNISNFFKSVLAFQRHFRARDTDLIVASFPKTGTTWLKSLLFSVANRGKYPIDQSPLRNKHPHEIVYRLEVDVYGDNFDYPRPHHLDELPAPRLLHTHMPYVSLPDSMKDSLCKVIYISRNPLDTLVSLWYFSLSYMKKIEGEGTKHPDMDEFFESFCQGNVVQGPFFEHIIEYWKQSIERPDKVFFLKYEDLKDDPVLNLKKLAEFMGMPFSIEEENEGVIDQIIEFCSISNMKGLEGNKSGVFNKFFEKSSYFRKGEVGDWAQHLTPDMAKKMDELMREKLEGTGLSFKLKI